MGPVHGIGGWGRGGMQRRATRGIRSVSVPWLASMRGALVSAGNREWCRGVAVCVCERPFSFAPNGSSSRACLGFG